ncbi:MAG: hypothetical protein AUK35_02420 [Zetaproteobacteria bacterium CG2_30_46_52]|nr:MAG: hypothetical protein AUK35_02420 [Zetaproteobacteria bacterium CG2_30_46_52]
MQIKVFTATRLHEALAMVRQAFGPDAVILDRIENKTATGAKEWRVHAALDIDMPESKPQKVAAQDLSASKLEASMKRLERIAASLGNRDGEQYRQSLSKPSVQDAYDHLLSMGLSPVIAYEMAEDYAQQKPVMMASLFWSEPIVVQKKRSVVLLTGPSGAGKTLLIAKLATHYSLKGIKVHLMTTDTNRMGGSDVLRSYAAILGVPFSVIRNEQDAKTAKTSSKSAQLVLIDSEGWNNRHASGLRNQMELWQTLACTHRILLLPASMDESDGLQMLKQAQGAHMTQIAFSKLDETLRPGKIVNWAEASGMAMSYCSFGPEVPEQMGWLTPTALTALLVKHYRQQLADIEGESFS